jgi:hypothetical protein
VHSDSLITYAVGTALQSHRFSSSTDAVCLALRVISLSLFSGYRCRYARLSQGSSAGHDTAVHWFLGFFGKAGAALMPPLIGGLPYPTQSCTMCTCERILHANNCTMCA